MSARGHERHIDPPALRVVSHEEALQSGLRARPFSATFGSGRDGTELVEHLLKNAEAEGAVLVSDITIVLASQDSSGASTECRSEVVPVTVTESRWSAGGYRVVPVNQPVTRMVTESEYRCHMASHPETRMVTEYQQRCQSVSRPVTHTRTSYSYQYDSFSHSSRSVPRTESYTTYESHQECRSEPVSRMRTESVMRNECQFEPVTHLVTRYEFQMQSQYVPPRLETMQRFRLKELAPECYAVDAVSQNRLEATYYFSAKK